MYTSPRVCHEAKAIYKHRWYKTLLSCPCSIHTAYCKGFSRNSKGKCSPFEVGPSVIFHNNRGVLPLIASIGWMQSFTYTHTYIHTLCKGQMLQAQTIALHLLGAAGLQDSLAKITTREPVTLLAGWLAAWGMAGWLRPRKAREAQRGPERRTVDRTSLSCAWLEAPHKQICDQGGSPQISSRNQRGSPAYYHYICMQGSRPWKFPTSRITTREAYPQEEL